MNQQELQAIIERGEDGQHQFKAGVTNVNALAAEMVAFSNSAGGMILIGVQDDGAFAGLTRDDMNRLNQLVSNAASQSVRPPVNPQTQNIATDNGLVMVVEIPKGISKPYMDNNGLIWIKSGADKRKVTAREEIQRMYQAAGLVHGDEIPAKGLGINSLDKEYFDTFLKKHFNTSLDDLDIPLETLLENMNLMRDGVFNVAGALLFTRNPSFYLPVFVVKAVSFPGMDTNARTYRDSQDMEGKMLNVFPILGIELTATPKTVGANPRDFSNIIYHYPLSIALQDGYVKIPAVATRKDFNLKDYSPEQLETIKLEDGIHHHEYVRVELQTYAHTSGNKPVKPFMLVVAQDTQHAGQIKALIQSDAFFGGRFKDKVIEVHSNLSGDESDEAMARLLAVEHDADTEIVIHVNKLKEGWDVTNLYTIVPLRASASEILTEQTIGRGLRLPYGKRTGVEAVDRLTIIAHDRFQEILDRARDGESIIRKTVYIGGGDDADIPDKKPQLVETPSIVDMLISGKTPTVDGRAISKDMGAEQPQPIINTERGRKIATTTLQIIREETRKLASSQDLHKLEVQQEIARKVQTRIQPAQTELPGLKAADETEKSVVDVVKTVSETLIKYTIDIPQIVILPTREVNYGFSDFDLQGLDKINYQPVSQEILLKHLEGEQDKHTIHFGVEQAQETRPENYIVRKLMDRNEIDYDTHAGLLYKLAGQVVTHLQSQGHERQKVANILIYYQKPLCNFIWAQMQGHQWSTPTDYQGKVIKGFDILEPNTWTMAAGEKPRDFRAPVQNKQAVRKMLFSGFKRCCYPYQKFDSVDGELALAKVLEDDETVLKWMKPASGKFKIEYQSGHWYEPDFVVETHDACLLIEPKRADEVDDATIKSKQKATERWCRYANEHAAQVGGKRWDYLLIPHNDILSNASVAGLTARFSSHHNPY